MAYDFLSVRFLANSIKLLSILFFWLFVFVFIFVVTLFGTDAYYSNRQARSEVYEIGQLYPNQSQLKSVVSLPTDTAILEIVDSDDQMVYILTSKDKECSTLEDSKETFGIFALNLKTNLLEEIDSTNSPLVRSKASIYKVEDGFIMLGGYRLEDSYSCPKSGSWFSISEAYAAAPPVYNFMPEAYRYRYSTNRWEHLDHIEAILKEDDFSYYSDSGFLSTSRGVVFPSHYALEQKWLVRLSDLTIEKLPINRVNVADEAAYPDLAISREMFPPWCGLDYLKWLMPLPELIIKDTTDPFSESACSPYLSDYVGIKWFPNDTTFSWVGGYMVAWPPLGKGLGEIYDIDRNTWRTISSNGAPPNDNYLLIPIGDKLVVEKKIDYDSGSQDSVSPLYLLDPDKNSWEKLETNFLEYTNFRFFSKSLSFYYSDGDYRWQDMETKKTVDGNFKRDFEVVGILSLKDRVLVYGYSLI